MHGGTMDESPHDERLAEAFRFAHRLHHGQVRRKTGAPVIAHLMGVASLVLEHGGSEDEAVAALLHDGPEDCGGRPVLEEIHRRFGPAVAQIVEGCSDSLESPKPAWLPRKEGYLRRLPGESATTQLVSLADKVYNVKSIVEGYRREGARLWQRFTATRDETLWYYRSLLEIFQRTAPSPARPMVEELARLLTELETLIEAGEKRQEA